jgi:hypothetical protein
MEMNFEELANSKDWNDRYWAAKNSNCPIHLLEKLADDKDGFVRSGVAENPNCPVHLLEKLVDDEENEFGWRVYWPVEENPNCPQYLKDYIKTKNFIRYYGNQF